MGATLASGAFSAPDETRAFDHGHLEVVHLGEATAGRFTLEPGWRWSRSMAPTVGTSSCRQPHLGCVLSGRMHVVMDDGSEGDAGPGDVFRIAPGHDAWTVGDEPVVLVDFQGAARYALPA